MPHEIAPEKGPVRLSVPSKAWRFAPSRVCVCTVGARGSFGVRADGRGLARLVPALGRHAVRTTHVVPLDSAPQLGVDANAASMLPRIGDVVADKYRIDAVIGRGGMSVVYLATHLELDQHVALKVLSAAALLLPEYVVRLKREARAVSHIRSEHVARVYDIGMLEGANVPYLVMEHLTGYDLATILGHHEQLPVDYVAMCVLQSCEALAEAHALGIIHRDLKPANLFVTENVDGSACVKVLDFGISRMTRAPGLSPLTDPGTVLGTPSYMAPEQMEASAHVDGRSDIWALGTIIYELLVGQPPYTGASLPQIFVKIMRAHTPRPSAHRSVPPLVDKIVARCLAIDPDKRYQTVAELAAAIAELGPAGSRAQAERIARITERCSPHASVAVSTPPAPPASHVTPVSPRREGGLGAALAKVSSALFGNRT